MALVVHSMVSYASYSNTDYQWRQSDYNNNKLVKSLKDEPVRGYADIRDIDGSWMRITDDDNTAAYRLFTNWACQRLRSLDLGEFVLVPVPSSHCITFNAATTPIQMAQRVQSVLAPEASLGYWLRFSEIMPRSHEGGVRSQALFEEKLRVSPEVTAAHVVLLDDVKTTGAHLRACAARLREYGATVEHAIVAASTVWEPHPTPEHMPQLDIESVVDFTDLDDLV